MHSTMSNPSNHNTILTADDIPEPYGVLLEALTVDEIVNLADTISGIRIYFKRGNFEETKAFDIISECIGYPKAVEVCRIFAGEHIYFTSLDQIRTQKLHETIRAEYNGYNAMTLAMRFRYSEYYINSIVNGGNKNRGTKSPMEGQIGIDEIW